MTRGRQLLIFKVMGQRSRSHTKIVFKSCKQDNPHLYCQLWRYLPLNSSVWRFCNVGVAFVDRAFHSELFSFRRKAVCRRFLNVKEKTHYNSGNLIYILIIASFFYIWRKGYISTAKKVFNFHILSLHILNKPIKVTIGKQACRRGIVCPSYSICTGLFSFVKLHIRFTHLQQFTSYIKRTSSGV